MSTGTSQIESVQKRRENVRQQFLCRTKVDRDFTVYHLFTDVVIGNIVVFRPCVNDRIDPGLMAPWLSSGIVVHASSVSKVPSSRRNHSFLCSRGQCCITLLYLSVSVHGQYSASEVDNAATGCFLLNKTDWTTAEHENVCGRRFRRIIGVDGPFKI